jgi:type I restriction enzyme S subunit
MSEEVTLDEFAGSSDSDDSREPLESRFWGEIPDGWELVNGLEVYEVNPNPKSAEELNTYIEMDALDTELPYPKYFGERNASEYSGKTFTKGDTLFARITPCTENGKAALVPEMDTKVGIGSTEYAVLSPKTNRINPWLLYYLSKSHPVHNYAVSRMRGSTGRQRVPFSVFRRELDIALPPLSEQRKVATVLYIVDQAIEKTEEIIEQNEKIGRGLRRSLFTEGYYEHETESYGTLGEVPASWEKTRLYKIADVARGKFTHRPRNDPDFYGGEYPFIQTGEVVDAVGELTDYSQTLNEKGRGVSREFALGTIIITIAGNIGDTAVATFPVYFPDSLVGITPDEETDERFLEHFLRYRQPFLNRLSTKTTQKNLNLTLLRPIEVVKPPLDEQKEIADVLSTIDGKIKKEKKYKNHLQRLKPSLMQDLLSGTVRTTDTNIEVPEEIAQYG